MHPFQKFNVFGLFKVSREWILVNALASALSTQPESDFTFRRIKRRLSKPLDWIPEGENAEIMFVIDLIDRRKGKVDFTFVEPIELEEELINHPDVARLVKAVMDFYSDQQWEEGGTIPPNLSENSKL